MPPRILGHYLPIDITWIVMNGPDFQLHKHLESPRRHEEEVDRLLRGIKATQDELRD
jgi:hypothetical protein